MVIEKPFSMWKVSLPSNFFAISAMSLRGGRLGATHTYQRGVFSARELGISRSTLWRKMKRYGID